jgi:hypothetical protein
MNNLNEVDAIFASNYFINYFESFGRIDEYFRQVKLEKMESYPNSLPGMGMGDYMFSEFDMRPEDMTIEIRQNDQMYDDLLELTASHVVEKSVPGRTIKLTVYEKTTNSVIGFIRLGSCVINSKPRNIFLGRPLETSNLEAMQRFNKCSVMGHIIVPAQPFGFNYLGGKLLAGICCSHEIKKMFDAKYDTNICHFETTSLYGSSKASSQYDGMKPFLRFKGLTDSDFTPLLNDKVYKTINSFFKDRNGGKELYQKPDTVDIPTSPKMKTQGMMIGLIRKSLKENAQTEQLAHFNKVMVASRELNEHKRVFISNYGYENSKEYILGEADELKKAENYEKFDLDNIILWWKKMANKRHANLKTDGRIRRELELWNEKDDIDIIR